MLQAGGGVARSESEFRTLALCRVQLTKPLPTSITIHVIFCLRSLVSACVPPPAWLAYARSTQSSGMSRSDDQVRLQVRNYQCSLPMLLARTHLLIHSCSTDHTKSNHRKSHPALYPDPVRPLYPVDNRTRKPCPSFCLLQFRIHYHSPSTYVRLRLQPFLPDDSPVHTWIPDRRWAITLPSLVLVVGLTTVGVYAGLLLREDALHQLAQEKPVLQK